ncbi:Heterokaryon incompatibility protein (HET) domain containing protein [Rhypophila sp. PSN 637]
MPDLVSKKLPLQWPGRFVPFYGCNLNNDADNTVQPNRLCSRCVVIRNCLRSYTGMRLCHCEYSSDEYQFLQKAVRAAGFYLDSELLRLPYHLHLPHYETAKAFESSVQSGCHLCALLWNSVTDGFVAGSTTEERLEKRKNLERANHIDILINLSPSRVPCFLEVSLRGLPKFGTVAGYCLSVGTYDRSPHVELSRFSLCYGLTTSSTAAKNWAVERLDSCLSHHKKCRQTLPSERYTPTRLVDLSLLESHDLVRLVETGPEQTCNYYRYTTLSYSWGGTSVCMLRTDNLCQFRHGMRASFLPKTLQDAISVTLWFGFRYIWIDSICTLQDDPDDWKLAAKSMSLVYRNSQLTIAALKAKDSSEGCFSMRNPLLHQPCKLYGNEQEDEMFAMPHRDDKWRFGDFWSSHLHTRAWAFQEYTLSPRTLYFGDTLRWECCEDTSVDVLCRRKLYTDGSCKLQDDMTNRLQSKNLIRHLQDHETWMRTGRATVDWLQAFCGIWQEVVEKYTSANLTVTSDRVVALDGVIDLVKAYTGFRNHAGIWEEFMIEQLPWRCVLRESTAPTERSQLLAPSWSWMSVSWPVNGWNYPSYRKPPIFLSRFLSANTQSVSRELSRDVKIEGELVIQGPLFRISKLGFILSGKGNVPLDHLRIEGWPLDIGKAQFFPDSKLPEGHPFFTLLPLYEYYMTDSYHIRCLVLVRSRKSSIIFERIGMLQLEMVRSSCEYNEAFPKAKNTIITLV